MRLHVIPFQDKRQGERAYHAASASCACCPLETTVKSDVDGSRNLLFIHNAFDLREKWERQDIETPGWVSVEEL